MTRRGAGEGTVFYDEGRNLWVGIADLGTVDGRRRRKTVRARRKEDMLAKLREVQSRHDRGLPVIDGSTPTAAWLNWWADNVLPGTVTATTEAGYRTALKNWVIPHIGRVPLGRLGPEHVQGMMRALEAQGLAVRTRIFARAVLRRSLGQAERWGKVARNAAALVEAPSKAGTRLDDALDATEAAAVLEAVKGERLEALAVLVLGTGLRRGEALRLRWDHVDLDATPATLTVVRSKTEAGRRTITLPPFVVAALRAHRARQAAERLAALWWGDDQLVFTTPNGTAVDPNYALRWWWDMTIRAGVGRRRFHATRHTAATLMLNAGVPLEVVSATLGHAGLAITADVYAKVRPQLQRRAAEAMERVLGGTT
jgi:integrase